MKPALIFDVETFGNYFLAGFLHVETGKYLAVESRDDSPLDVEHLRRILRKHQLVTFNGSHFDLPMTAYALKGATCAQIKLAAGMIIHRNLQAWQFEDMYGCKVPKVDHIDLIEVAPGVASLKIYGGRMHCQRMQDLPFDHDDKLTSDQMDQVLEYNRNDLLTTLELYRRLLPQIHLREQMSEQYGIDLRSKSDAQIAEAVIVAEIERLAAKKIERLDVDAGTVVRFQVPSVIRFQSAMLQDKLAEIAAAEFVVRDNGSIVEPPCLHGQAVDIGAGRYRLGIGGLHSSEQSQAIEADDEYVLVDRDVASYYPNIILKLGLAPANMGAAFTRVYQGIVDRRLAAKRAGDRVTADVLKIVVNGSFGKFGSKYSKLYSPQLLIQVTITGQLALLMLIEALEQSGIQVVSANTDGIVIRAKNQYQVEQIIADWEQRTGFETEETAYSAIYSRDVNNYIAIKPDCGHKVKGAYASASLAKNPTTEICVQAAIAWLKHGTSIEQTVRTCRDIRQFVCIRTVKGGAVKGGQRLGRAVRWYYALGVEGTINYQVNGYKVPGTDGARPLMDLPAEFPDDVNVDFYIRQTQSILEEIGALAAFR
jgi:DNA polymerase elongation subunit (family B)